MGRKTYDSLGKPLPNRTNIVITRQEDYQAHGAMIAHNLEEALKIEKDLRPLQNIGWNNQIGGNLGVESSWYNNIENNKKHSENTSKATKLGIKDNDTKEARSKRAKLNRLNNPNSYKDNNLGSKNPKAILTEEQVKEIKYKLLHSDLKGVEIAKLYEVKPHVISFIKTGKNWKHVTCDSPGQQ